MKSWNELVRYVLVGLANTAVGLTFIYGAMFLGFNDVVSNVIGYSVGLVNSFYLNGRWTFGRSNLSFQQLGKFIAVMGGAYAINLFVMLTSRDVFHCSSVLAQFLGVAAYSVAGFIGMKLFAFRQVVQNG